MRLSSLPFFALSCSLVFSLSVVREERVETTITSPPTGTQYIEINTIELNNELFQLSTYYEFMWLAEDNFYPRGSWPVHLDSYTFMWIPNYVAFNGLYAIYTSNQINQSPEPYCAVIRLDQLTMQRTGQVDGLPTSSINDNGFDALFADPNQELVYAVHRSKIQTFTNGASFMLANSTSFNDNGSRHRTVVDYDNRMFYMINGAYVSVFDMDSLQITEMIPVPSMATRGTLRAVTADFERGLLWTVGQVGVSPGEPDLCFISLLDIKNSTVIKELEINDELGCDGISSNQIFTMGNSVYAAMYGNRTPRAFRSLLREFDQETLEEVGAHDLDFSFQAWTKYGDNVVVAGSRPSEEYAPQYVMELAA